MVPIVAREVNAETVPEALRKLNWIFCRDGDDFGKKTDELISALETHLEWVHAHTRLLTRAIEWENNDKNNSFVLRGDDLRPQSSGSRRPLPTRNANLPRSKLTTSSRVAKPLLGGSGSRLGL
jgi:hypothetical protein